MADKQHPGARSTTKSQLRTWLWEAAVAWTNDNAMRMSSSLAYYALLSAAPLLLLAVSIAGLFLGDEIARGQVSGTLTRRLGEEAGLAIDAFLVSANDPEESLAGTIAGLVMLFIGASGAFGELQSAMNTIWQVTPRRGRGLWGMLRDRFVCFAMVGSVALLLLVLLVIGAVLALLGARIGTLPGGIVLWQGVDLLLSIVAVAVLIALIYKTVPDVKIPLREIWPAALLTAGMFTLGELALAVYLRVWAVPKPQGVAGSIVVLIIWLYYSGQILFYGAEFTKVRAAARGVQITPRRHAVRTRAFSLDNPTTRRPIDRLRDSA